MKWQKVVLRRLERAIINGTRRKGLRTLRSPYIQSAHRSALIVVVAAICWGCAAIASGSSAMSRPELERSTNYRQWNAGRATRSSEQSRRLRFSLPGSNNYKLTVTGFKGRATLVASLGHTASIYISTRVNMDNRYLTAKFGHLGIVSVRFKPDRLHVRSAPNPPRGCSVTPQKVVEQLGTFVGEIRFRGEEGFTSVSKNYATGSAGPIQHQICKHQPSGDATSRRAQVHAMRVSPRLRVLSPAGRDLVDFRAGKGAFSSLTALRFGASLSARNLPTAGVPFSVVSIERKQAMEIVRMAIAKGGSSSFKFNRTLTTTMVSPPLPFSGVGYFRSCPARKWSGSLSVSLPGKKDEALTGQRFFLGARLQPEGTCEPDQVSRRP